MKNELNLNQLENVQGGCPPFIIFAKPENPETQDNGVILIP